MADHENIVEEKTSEEKKRKDIIKYLQKQYLEAVYFYRERYHRIHHAKCLEMHNADENYFDDKDIDEEEHHREDPNKELDHLIGLCLAIKWVGEHDLPEEWKSDTDQFVNDFIEHLDQKVIQKFRTDHLDEIHDILYGQEHQKKPDFANPSQKKSPEKTKTAKAARTL